MTRWYEIDRREIEGAEYVLWATNNALASAESGCFKHRRYVFLGEPQSMAQFSEFTWNAWLRDLPLSDGVLITKSNRYGRIDPNIHGDVPNAKPPAMLMKASQDMVWRNQAMDRDGRVYGVDLAKPPKDFRIPEATVDQMLADGVLETTGDLDPDMMTFSKVGDVDGWPVWYPLLSVSSEDGAIQYQVRYT